MSKVNTSWTEIPEVTKLQPLFSDFVNWYTEATDMTLLAGAVATQDSHRCLEAAAHKNAFCKIGFSEDHRRARSPMDFRMWAN